jgi:hypothetical protein
MENDPADGEARFASAISETRSAPRSVASKRRAGAMRATLRRSSASGAMRASARDRRLAA